MESRIIELLSEEIRETKKLTLEVRKETQAIREETHEIRKIAEIAKRQADASWELVIMTREEMKQMNRPFLKKWLANS